jgi:hypothetical protein
MIRAVHPVNQMLQVIRALREGGAMIAEKRVSAETVG